MSHYISIKWAITSETNEPPHLQERSHSSSALQRTSINILKFHFNVVQCENQQKIYFVFVCDMNCFLDQWFYRMKSSVMLSILINEHFFKFFINKCLTSRSVKQMYDYFSFYVSTMFKKNLHPITFPQKSFQCLSYSILIAEGWRRKRRQRSSAWGAELINFLPRCSYFAPGWLDERDVFQDFFLRPN